MVDVLITSLKDEHAVAQLAHGKDGFLSAMEKDGLRIETGTVDPDAFVALARESRRLGINTLEVPIVGNQDMVKQQKVVLLVGGEKELFQKYEKFLRDLSNKILYVGPEGYGLKMNLVINLFHRLVAESFSVVLVLYVKL